MFFSPIIFFTHNSVLEIVAPHWQVTSYSDQFNASTFMEKSNKMGEKQQKINSKNLSPVDIDFSLVTNE